MTFRVGFYDDAHTFGGAQVALIRAVEALSTCADLKITVAAAQANAKLFERLQQMEGIQVVSCPSSLPSNIFFFWVRCFELRKLMNKPSVREVDAWIVNLAGIEFGLGFALWLKLSRRQAFGWLHNPIRLTQLMPLASPIKLGIYFARDWFADRFVFKLYEELFMPSKAASEALWRRTRRLPAVSVLYCPGPSSVAGSRADSLKAMLTGSVVIAVVGRIEFSTKGQDRVPLVHRRLIQEGFCPQVLYVGDGPDRAALEKSIEQLGLTAFSHVTGWVEDVPSHVGPVDLVFVPSRFETLSLVAVEALMAGKRLVTSELECFSEFVPPYCVSSSGRTDDFVEAIVRVLAVEPEGLKTLYRGSVDKFSNQNFTTKFCARVCHPEFLP